MSATSDGDAAPLKILKFGGTSVANPRELRQVVRLAEMAREEGPTVVVVSAIRGVTDQLMEVVDHPLSESEGRDLVARLRQRHLVGLTEWLSPQDLAALGRRLDKELGRLLLALQAPSSSRRAVLRHEVLASGERLSVARLAACLRSAGAKPEEVDGTLVLKRSQDGSAHLERLDAGLLLLERLARSPDSIPIVTGFIASDERGRIATLGRGASDLSATALASLLQADSVEIWTDTPGILSADPLHVPRARCLPRLFPQEATALARYGAKVLHPDALLPLRGTSVSIKVLSTMEPEARGTEIGPRSESLWGGVIAKSITFLDLDAYRAGDLCEGEAHSPPELEAWLTRGARAPGQAALAVLAVPGHEEEVLEVIQELLKDHDRFAFQHFLEPAGPANLVVAITARNEIERLLPDLHERLDLGEATVSELVGSGVEVA